MKNWVIAAVLLAMLLVGGCGSELATGTAGVVGGFAASETVKGLEADLANREKLLIERYNTAVKAGAKQETLDALERDIGKTQTVQQGVEAGKKILQVDWNDPTEAGSAIGLIGTLAYAFFTGRKLKRTEAGVNKFIGKSQPEIAGDLYDCLKDKKAT